MDTLMLITLSRQLEHNRAITAPVLAGSLFPAAPVAGRGIRSSRHAQPPCAS